MVVGNIQPPTTFALPAAPEKATEDESCTDKIVATHLKADESVKLFDVLRPFASMWSEDLGQIYGVKHYIDTGDSALV